jgi:hypothetical protein
MHKTVLHKFNSTVIMNKSCLLVIKQLTVLYVYVNDQPLVCEFVWRRLVLINSQVTDAVSRQVRGRCPSIVNAQHDICVANNQTPHFADI